MGNQQQSIYTCIENKSSRLHEQSILETTITRSPGCKSPNYKIGIAKGDDTIDDINQSSVSEVAQEEEPWAVRFAEMFRIEVA